MPTSRMLGFVRGQHDPWEKDGGEREVMMVDHVDHVDHDPYLINI
jgi:hypothetical protein